MPQRYVAPDWFTRNVFNRIVAALTRLGISVWGAAGEGVLLLGRRRERFIGSEIADSEKEPILRAYLKRWKWEVGQFFSGVDAESPSDDVRRIAPDHPIFRVEPWSESDSFG
jgi:hypothetical protein